MNTETVTAKSDGSNQRVISTIFKKEFNEKEKQQFHVSTMMSTSENSRGNYSVCTNELTFLLPIFTLSMNNGDHGQVNLASMSK